jgi:hypothetical protein
MLPTAIRQPAGLAPPVQGAPLSVAPFRDQERRIIETASPPRRHLSGGARDQPIDHLPQAAGMVGAAPGIKSTNRKHLRERARNPIMRLGTCMARFPKPGRGKMMHPAGRMRLFVRRSRHRSRRRVLGESPTGRARRDAGRPRLWAALAAFDKTTAAFGQPRRCSSGHRFADSVVGYGEYVARPDSAFRRAISPLFRAGYAFMPDGDGVGSDLGRRRDRTLAG